MLKFGWKNLSLGLPVLLQCYTAWDLFAGELTLPRGLEVALTDVVTHVTPKLSNSVLFKQIQLALFILR